LITPLKKHWESLEETLTNHYGKTLGKHLKNSEKIFGKH
jgi:hypothetical protein